VLLSPAVTTAKGSTVNVIGLIIIAIVVIVALLKAPVVFAEGAGATGLVKAILNGFKK